ncbi:MAG: hypothetical protein ACRC1H_09225 [Caldilineaceae bacterium]
MDDPKPDPTPIQAGRVMLEQHQANEVTLVHRGKAGEVRVVVPASQLERWAMRQMRDGVFA